jgi:ATP-dependent DNA ligase I
MTEQKIMIGKFVDPMLVAESDASDTKFAEVMKRHKGRTLAEIKYDGYRVQVHKGSKVSLYTRNSNPLNPEVFPEISEDLDRLPRGIYDGELVGYGSALDGFNAVKKRVRDELDESLVEECPVQIKFFDVLQLENRLLVDQPLAERRSYLEDYVQNYSEQTAISDSEQLKAKFEEVTSQKLEGLVCKNPDSIYVPGSKTKDWIKLKNFMSLDFVVLGVYKGEGKASTLPFAAVLVGTSNNGRYETISKVGISNREMIDSLYKKIKPSLVKTAPGSLSLSPEINKKTYARKLPSMYVNPQASAVVEVSFLNITRSNNWHSCGLEDGKAYSLRIATLKNLRFDKRVQDCNTTEQVAELYTG